MGTANIRKIVVTVEETLRELDQEINPPVRKAVAAAVIENPCAPQVRGGSRALAGHRG